MSNESMTQKEVLNDLLNCEKTMVKTYATFVTEASCGQLHQLLERQMMECAEDHFSVFQLMKQRNMYQGKMATKEDTQQAIQSCNQLKQETGF